MGGAEGHHARFPWAKWLCRKFVGDISVILERVEAEEAERTLFSTVDGAGPVMSRTAARGNINRKAGEIISLARCRARG